MKAVDVIVELEDRVSFIEIKDFDHPRAPSENRAALIEDFQNERLDHDLVYKFRDSFLYEWACKRIDKPIDYWILIASEVLTKAHLGPRIEAIRSAAQTCKEAVETEGRCGMWRVQYLDLEYAFSQLSYREDLTGLI